MSGCALTAEDLRFVEHHPIQREALADLERRLLAAEARRAQQALDSDVHKARGPAEPPEVVD